MSASTSEPTPLVIASDRADTKVDWLSMLVLVPPSDAPAAVMLVMAVSIAACMIDRSFVPLAFVSLKPRMLFWS